MSRSGKLKIGIYKNWLSICLGLVTLCSIPGVHAWQKNLRFEHLSTEQGLSHVFVHAITQDKQGFMWFGTANGLNKFDGHRVTVYKNDPDDPTSISDGPVNELFVDHEGVLWAGGAALHRFDREENSFTRFTHDPDDPSSISENDVLSIFEDHEGMLWVGTWNTGLNRFDRANESFTRYQNNPEDPTSLPNGPVRAIYETSDGVLWVGTYTRDDTANLSRFDRETGKFEAVLSCESHQPFCAEPLNDSDRPPSAVVAGILEDESGILWIGGYGLIRFDRTSNSYKRYFNDPENDDYPHINNFTGDLVEDQAGLLWFGESYYGLHSLDPVTEIFTQYLHDPSDMSSIGSSDLMTIFKDRDGMIWTASYFAGVSRFDPRSLAFGHYRHDPKDSGGLGGKRVDAVAEDQQGYLWVAAGGLNKIDRKSGVVALYRHDPDAPNSLHNNDIRTLLFDHTGILWMGTVDGLARFDPNTGMFKHYPIMPRAEENNNDLSVYSIIEDSKGMLWLGTSQTLTQFNPTSGAVVHFPAESDTSTGPRGSHFELFLAKSGHIWISSWSQGVTRFDPLSGSFKHFDHDPENANSIGKGLITSMIHGENDGIWFATGFGVDLYDSANGQWSHYTKEEGVPDGSIFKIILDQSGVLWLGTDGSGLTKFNPHTGFTKQYTSRDGLQGEFFRAGLLSQSGEIILGGNNGLNIFHPDHLPEYETEPAVAITDFLLFNQPVPISNSESESPLSGHISENPDITLTYKDYLFSFEFSALNYFNPETTRYAYKLEGFDQDWVETDASKRFATYTSVPAGEYILHVKASGTNGGWSNKTASLNLKILPPPWKTWWAYSIYLAVFVLLLYGYVRWRTVALRNQAIELETTVKERTREIRDHEQVIQHQADSLKELLQLKEKLYANISHEFRTPLTLILGPIRRLLNKDTNLESHEQLEVVQRNSERLLRLVDQLLGLSRLSAQKQSAASPQSLLSHVEAMVESFRTLAQEKDLSLLLGKSENLWVSCAPGALEKILMNLLSNAIKYTPFGGKITLEVSSEGEDTAVLSVSDTGIGIHPDEHETVFERFHRIGDAGETVPGAGIGLALVKELTESYGGSVELVSTLGEGTTISIKFPRQEMVGQEGAGREIIQVSATTRRESNSISQPGSFVSSDEAGYAEERRSILIVEDNPDMQNYIHSLLDHEYVCLVAGNGRDGFEVALEQVPDLIVSDVMMPEMDGYELTQILKEDQRTSHIPIIMLTARSDQESKLKGLREHADDYLVKPFDDEELLLRISNQLTARDIMRARFTGHVYQEDKLSTGLNEREELFIERFEAMLEKSHANSELDIGNMASQIAVSTRQLQRKLKALTGHSPAEYLRAYRLKKAAGLLRAGGQISQVAMDVGFASQAYFGTCFKAQFGFTPKQFQQKKSQY